MTNGSLSRNGKGQPCREKSWSGRKEGLVTAEGFGLKP